MASRPASSTHRATISPAPSWSTGGVISASCLVAIRRASATTAWRNCSIRLCRAAVFQVLLSRLRASRNVLPRALRPSPPMRRRLDRAPKSFLAGQRRTLQALRLTPRFRRLHRYKTSSSRAGRFGISRSRRLEARPQPRVRSIRHCRCLPISARSHQASRDRVRVAVKFFAPA
ncbi:hypothetical protein D3C87_1545910 [compost metagenome]